MTVKDLEIIARDFGARVDRGRCWVCVVAPANHNWVGNWGSRVSVETFLGTHVMTHEVGYAFRSMRQGVRRVSR